VGGSANRRRLKILHVDPERNWGGGEAQVVGLLKWLAEKGHQNDLVAHPDGPLIAKCESLARRCHGFVVRNDLDFRCIPGLRRLVRDGGYDIVHFHTKRAHVLSLWLPRGSDMPRYLVTRRMDYPESPGVYTTHLYNRRVDGVIAISQSIASSLIAAGVDRKNLRMIHEGVDVQHFAPGSNGERSAQSGGTVIGAMGILDERKGHLYLLQALGRLKAKGLQLRCRIAGQGLLRQKLEKDAVGLGVGEQVEFVGFVEDTAGFLAGIDVFIMPSLFEGLGVAALEAMATAKPVIASRVGGLAESVVDNVTGLLVPPGDAAQLADAIEKLHSDPERARALGRKGRERAQQYYSVEEMATKNEVFYYDLLESSH
jgi:glycosyltransferase involved in cell wall biosynthesis